ncbi:MAG: hypothetical protein QM778_34570 [Myxococcales bacterium]
MTPARAIGAGLVLGCALGACLSQVELAPGAPDQIVVLGEVPAQIIERFARERGGTSDGRLRLDYPATNTELPADLAAMRFAWSVSPKAPPAPKPMPMAPKAKGDPPAKNADYFELCLQTERRTSCAYTDATQLFLEEQTWRPLLEDAAHVVVRLRGLAADSPEPMVAADSALSVVSPSARGSVYFVQDGSRLRRAPLSAAMADDVELALDGMSAVYAVSRDGTRLALARAPDQLEIRSLPSLEVVASASWPAPCAAPPDALAFDPGGRRLVFACTGALVLVDADTAAPIPLSGELAQARLAQPSWSPDGRQLVFALWPDDPMMPAAPEQEGTSLARSHVSVDGSFGPVEILVQSDKRDDTLAFPSFSPTGDWIAFLRAKGKLRDAREAQPWLVAAAGGSPLALELPKEPKAKLTLASPVAFPSWLPSEDGTLAWLTFSAQGWLTPTTQLWSVPVHFAELGGPEARALPPIWLPFQPLDGNVLAPAFAPR